MTKKHHDSGKLTDFKRIANANLKKRTRVFKIKFYRFEDFRA